MATSHVVLKPPSIHLVHKAFHPAGMRGTAGPSYRSQVQSMNHPSMFGVSADQTSSLRTDTSVPDLNAIRNNSDLDGANLDAALHLSMLGSTVPPSSYQLNEHQPLESDEPPAKRRRGRPNKVLVSDDAAAPEAAARRKRGRPRKEASENTAPPAQGSSSAAAASILNSVGLASGSLAANSNPEAARSMRNGATPMRPNVAAGPPAKRRGRPLGTKMKAKSESDYDTDSDCGLPPDASKVSAPQAQSNEAAWKARFASDKGLWGKILWKLRHCLHDGMNYIHPGKNFNMTQPPCKLIIRGIDCKPISNVRYAEVMDVVYDRARQMLAATKGQRSGRGPHKYHYFRKNHPALLRSHLVALSNQFPELSYCAGMWKAKRLIKAAFLYKRLNEDFQRAERKRRHDDTDDDGQEGDEGGAAVKDLLEHGDTGAIAQAIAASSLANH